MTELSTARDQTSVISNPSVWNYIISVAVSIVLIIMISRFVFNLVPERSEFVETEKVANEAYKKYSQRLKAISNGSAREINKTKQNS